MNEGDIANSTPTVVGVAGTAYTYFGLPLSAWVSVATIAYLVLQAIVLAPKAWAVICRVYRRIVKGEHSVEGNDDSP